MPATLYYLMQDGSLIAGTFPQPGGSYMRLLPAGSTQQIVADPFMVYSINYSGQAGTIFNVNQTAPADMFLILSRGRGLYATPAQSDPHFYIKPVN